MIGPRYITKDKTELFFKKLYLKHFSLLQFISSLHTYFLFETHIPHHTIC